MSVAKFSVALAACCVLLASSQPAVARFIRPEIEQVPVEKLAENLGKVIEENPKDAGATLNLARLHAMAYALKTDTTQVLKGKEDRGVFFGFTPKYIPFNVKETDDAEAAAAAKEHLEKSVELYKKTIELDDKNLAAQLGLGWTLNETGDKDAAVEQLRKTVELAWEKEQNSRSGRLGGHFVTVEATGYLVPLLDATKDADEIAELQGRAKKLSSLPRPVTPIAVPLTGDLQAAEILNTEAKVTFDADGTGRQQSWTWIHNNAGWLVYNGKGDGQVTSAIQMFGSVTFTLFWDNGYQALAALDDNADGELTGAELAHLAIWHDENENGISEPGEVKPLAEHGIVALSCTGQTSKDPHVVASNGAGVRFADGSSRATFDLLLEVAK